MGSDEKLPMKLMPTYKMIDAAWLNLG